MAVKWPCTRAAPVCELAAIICFTQLQAHIQQLPQGCCRIIACTRHSAVTPGNKVACIFSLLCSFVYGVLKVTARVLAVWLLFCATSHVQGCRRLAVCDEVGQVVISS